MGELVPLELEISEQSERGYKMSVIKITGRDERNRNHSETLGQEKKNSKKKNNGLILKSSQQNF